MVDVTQRLSELSLQLQLSDYKWEVISSEIKAVAIFPHCRNKSLLRRLNILLSLQYSSGEM